MIKRGMKQRHKGVCWPVYGRSPTKENFWFIHGLWPKTESRILVAKIRISAGKTTRNLRTKNWVKASAMNF